MLDPKILAKYTGFTEEVYRLCCKYDCDFNEVKHWYEGYFLQGFHIYNPEAVINVLIH